MNYNIVILAGLGILAVVILCGIIMYRRYLRARIKGPGFEMNLEGSNEQVTNDKASGKTQKTTLGALRNISIGKTKMHIKGQGTIADNKSMGDTEIKVDATPPRVPQSEAKIIKKQNTSTERNNK